MADLNKVDPLSQTSHIGHIDANTPNVKNVTPSSFLIRQWQLIRTFVNAVGTNIADLAAAIARIDATTITGTGALGGGGAIGSGNLTITHDNSAVTPGVYGDATHVAQVTVDAFGHVTAAADVPITAAGIGAQWSLVATRDFTTSPGATWDTPGLAGRTDVMVVMDGVVASAGSSDRMVRVSTDNGATFLAASGDYELEDTLGATTAFTGISLGSTVTVGARSGSVIINAVNVASAPKHGQGNRGAWRIDTTAVINAVRLTLSSGANMTAGVAYVYAR